MLLLHNIGCFKYFEIVHTSFHILDVKQFEKYNYFDNYLLFK